MVRFLVIRFSSIGDIILTTPVVRCLKQQVEDAEVHYITKGSFASILEANPYIDKIHVLENNLIDTICELREKEFDYIIDLHNNLRSLRIRSSLQRMFFAVNKLNFRKWLLVNFKIDRMPDVHIVDRYMETLHVFDVKNDNQGLDYFIPEKEQVDPGTLPEEFRKTFIALVIGAKHNTKKMPVEGLILITRKLLLPVVIIGGKEDSESGRKIMEALPDKHIYNACGKYSINQSASLVRMSAGVITHDTGMMHAAAAFRKKMIVIWGNTVPAFGMYPYLPGEGSIQVEAEGLRCRPCSKLGYDRCPRKHFRCMKDHDPEDIASMANKLFQ